MTDNQNSPTIWSGDLPKIGIRPTIDGRLGGVRESLENQTMNLAKRVAELICVQASAIPTGIQSSA